MRTLILALIVLPVFGQKPDCAVGLNTGNTITSGMVAAWPFCEGSGTSIADKVGSNNITLNGAVSWVSTSLGSSPSFDGTKWGTVTNVAGLNIETYTISLWLRTSVSTGSDTVFTHWGSTYPSTYPYEILLDQGATGIKLIWAGGGSGTLASTAANIFDQALHHIVITKIDGGAVRLWIDGTLNNSTTDATTGDSTNSSNIGISARVPAGDSAFRGIVDNIVVWNRVISDAEVGEMYNSPFGYLGGGALATARRRIIN